MPRLTTLPLALTFALALLGSCANTGTTDRMGLPADTHKQLSDEMRNLMQRMERLVYEREMTEREVREARIREAELLGRLTGELGIVTLKLFDAELQARTAETYRFERYVADLREHAASISELASGTDVAAMEQAFARMQNTCDACHRDYRDRSLGGAR